MERENFNLTMLIGIVLVVALLLPRSVDEWWYLSRGQGGGERLFFGAYLGLCLRDWYGCFALNLTRKASRSVRKPIGYTAKHFRRPRWCPVGLFAMIVNPKTQRIAFFTTMGLSFKCVLGYGNRSTYASVAVAATVVELRFHAALGWHRCILMVWTLWSFALHPNVAPAARVVALVHSYAGSGLSRLRVARSFSFAADARVVLEAGIARSLYPRLVQRLAAGPDLLLFVSGALARLGFELVGVAFLLASPAAATPFRLIGVIFHLAIAVSTSIDFFDNRLILLATLFDTTSKPTRLPMPFLDLLLVRIYLVLLLWPVLRLTVEDFPLTPNALFPFSATQMALVKEVHAIYHIHAVSSDDLIVDLVAVFLQSSPTQPAQLYHADVWEAVNLVHAGHLDVAQRNLRRWLRRNRPLLIERRDGSWTTLDDIRIIKS